MKIKTALSIALALATGALAQPYAAWGKYKEIAVNTKAGGANVANTVNNIPVLIRLNASNAADIFTGADAALPEGADIRISNGDGSAAVPFEIERWDAGNQVAEIWALASSVAGNDSVNTFRIYWKKAGEPSASNGPAVFTTDNGYVGAWHLGNGAGDVRPSSVTGAPYAFVNNGNGETGVQGVIGRADTLGGTPPTVASSDGDAGRWIDLNRDENGVSIGASAQYSDFTTGFSYSIWIYPSTFRSFYRLLALAPNPADAANRIVFMGNADSVPGAIAVRWTNGCGFVAAPNPNPCNLTADAVVNEAWNHVFFSKNTGSNGINVYVNGTFVGSSSNVNNASTANRIGWIGRAGDQNPYFSGKVDNVTLAKQARSADYVKLSYETQKAGAAAVVLGTTKDGDNTALNGASPAARYDFSARTSGAGALFRIAEAATASVTVSDVRGQVVWKGSFANGARELAWNGENASSGLYVARLTVLDKQGRASSVDRRFTLAR